MTVAAPSVPSASATRSWSVADYLQWAEEHEGRFEFANGEVLVMSPERSEHAVYKGNVFVALRTSARRDAPDLRVIADGISVVSPARAVREPDVTVNIGAPMRGSVTADRPFLLVEVSSPGSRGSDLNEKLSEYFEIPSVRHYLVVLPSKRQVVWYERADDGSIATRIVSDGTLTFAPYPLQLSLAECFDDTDFE